MPIVLTRKKNETVVAAPPGADESKPENQIKVTVVEIRGDKVRLGFDASRHWRIHRKEVWEQIYKKQEPAEEKPPEPPPAS